MHVAYIHVCVYVLQACRRDSSAASVEMLALKVAASLTVGIASGLWMFSPKSFQSWTGCLSRLCTRLSAGSTANKHGRPPTLVRPVVPAARHDSRPELSSVCPVTAAAPVGSAKTSSLYSALDVPQQRCNTVGRRTAVLSPTTIL